MITRISLKQKTEKCFVLVGKEQLFMQYFRIPKEGETGEYLLAVEILERIKRRKRDFNYSNTVIRTFGRLLARNRTASRRMSKGTYYQVIEI